jgi:hypothetical protein
MAEEHDWVWVGIDIVRANQVAGYRGRISAADFEAITEGGFVQPFVLIEDAHWVEVVWNERSEQREVKVSALGRTAQWRYFASTMYVRPETIAVIFPLARNYEQEYRQMKLDGPYQPGGKDATPPGGSPTRQG